MWGVVKTAINSNLTVPLNEMVRVQRGTASPVMDGGAGQRRSVTVNISTINPMRATVGLVAFSTMQSTATVWIENVTENSFTLVQSGGTAPITLSWEVVSYG